MKIVVIGGSGLIGSKVVNNLLQRGHEVVAASPSTGVNTITGEGLTEALAGAQVVVDVANAPSWEDQAVLEFFEKSGRNLCPYGMHIVMECTSLWNAHRYGMHIVMECTSLWNAHRY